MFYYDTRNEMVKNLIDLNSSICEFGTFEGSFIPFLLECNPKKITCVDLWDGIKSSGDENGNNLRKVDLNVAHTNLLKKYENDKRLLFIKDSTLQASKNILIDGEFDCVYIDADHSYGGVKLDLDIAKKIVKKGGWIMGHDYEINKEKCLYNYTFGVKRAVDEFCLKHNLSIYAKAKDGCVSYAIKNL